MAGTSTGPKGDVYGQALARRLGNLEKIAARLGKKHRRFVDQCGKGILDAQATAMIHTIARPAE